jgi:peptidoglycan/xylan/chitin deacetylase (PgdA/CDA1 family)
VWDKRVLRIIVALFVCVVAGVSVAASAETCPGNPDALGTSRELTISPGEFTLLGTIQYKQTLPLKDHEVVITFDDGPLPPYTNIILDTLASQCVKATYFLVGQMAHAYPSVVRRIYNEGHTIGTHSQHHPPFERLSMQRVEREVDGGINSVTAALGDAKALSPFFRIPYLGRTNAIERFLERKQLVTWSADVDTNDWWRGSSPGAIVKRTMRRLNAKGRGIILMHDTHRATAMALPILLKELKANGYNVVHVVAVGERPKSIPELMTLPAPDEKAPSTMLTNAPNGDDALTARQNHRIKKRRVSRHRPTHSWSEITTERPFWVFGGH